MNSVILREDDDADGQTIEDNIDVEAPLHDLPCLNPLVVNDLLDGVLLVDGLVQISKLEEQLRQVNVIEVQPLLEPAADFLTDDQRGEVDVGVLDDVVLVVRESNFLALTVQDHGCKFTLQLVEVIHAAIDDVICLSIG